MAKIGSLESIMEAIAMDVEGESTYPDPEALMMELRARSAPYIQGLTKIPFTLGQFVKARKGSNHKGEGQPLIVIEINQDAKPKWDENPDQAGSCNNGVRAQVRCLQYHQGNYVAFWYEAGVLEPYKG